MHVMGIMTAGVISLNEKINMDQLNFDSKDVLSGLHQTEPKYILFICGPKIS